MLDGRVLVVSSNSQTTDSLVTLVKSEHPAAVSTAASGAEARRRMLEGGWDVALVNAPLSDEFGDDLAAALTGAGGAVVLLVKGEMAGEIEGKTGRSGVMVVPKPISRSLLFQSLRLAGVMQARLEELRRENKKLQARIEELRLVDRAKCALIQYRGLTEQEAHKLIEREAMDGRITRRQVAEELIRTFEG